MRHKELREQWKRALNRADLQDPTKLFEPQKDHIVCSKHFVDGRPTVEHPVPELFLVSNSVPRALVDVKKAEASHNWKRRYEERESKKASDDISSDHTETSCPVPSGKRQRALSPHHALFTAIKFLFLLLFSFIRNLK